MRLFQVPVEEPHQELALAVERASSGGEAVERSRGEDRSEDGGDRGVRALGLWVEDDEVGEAVVQDVA